MSMSESSQGGIYSRTDNVPVLILMGHFANVAQIRLFQRDRHCEG